MFFKRKDSWGRLPVTGLVLTIASLVWLAAVTAGLVTLWRYAGTPGPAATAANWPTTSRLRRDELRPTLVMFVHPQCPCSRASVGELALLMTHTQQRVTTHVVVYRPSSAAPGWEHTDLWRSAEAIPSVHVMSDEEGALATAFGASVSGQTMLFDTDGQLIFSGGITGARGHSGDNEGRSAVVSLLTNIAAAAPRTPVFGCFLRESPPPQ